MGACRNRGLISAVTLFVLMASTLYPKAVGEGLEYGLHHRRTAPVGPADLVGCCRDAADVITVGLGPGPWPRREVLPSVEEHPASPAPAVARGAAVLPPDPTWGEATLAAALDAFPAGERRNAYRIAECESGFGSRDGAAGERGWWQIHPVHLLSVRILDLIGTRNQEEAYERLRDPVVNARVAAYLLSQRPGWVDWSTWYCLEQQ